MTTKLVIQSKDKVPEPIPTQLRQIERWANDNTFGGAETLSLSYNGNGPAECAVLYGLTYSTSGGGYAIIQVASSLIGAPPGNDQPGFAFIDNAGNIISLLLFTVGGTGGYGMELNNYDNSGNGLPILVNGLTIPLLPTPPGDNNNNVPAFIGQVILDYVHNKLYACVSNPPGAVWKSTTLT